MSETQHIWLTDTEAAQRARMELDTFQRKVRAGNGPKAGGTGGRRLYSREDVDRWIESGGTEQ